MSRANVVIETPLSAGAKVLLDGVDISARVADVTLSLRPDGFRTLELTVPDVNVEAVSAEGVIVSWHLRVIGPGGQVVHAHGPDMPTALRMLARTIEREEG